MIHTYTRRALQPRLLRWLCLLLCYSTKNIVAVHPGYTGWYSTTFCWSCAWNSTPHAVLLFPECNGSLDRQTNPSRGSSNPPTDSLLVDRDATHQIHKIRSHSSSSNSSTVTTTTAAAAVEANKTVIWLRQKHIHIGNANRWRMLQQPTVPSVCVCVAYTYCTICWGKMRKVRIIFEIISLHNVRLTNREEF